MIHFSWLWMVLFLIGLISSRLLKRQLPVLSLKIMRIICELVMACALFLLIASVFELSAEMVYMGGTLLLLILFIVVLIEVQREVAPRNRKFLAVVSFLPLALCVPVVTLYLKLDQSVPLRQSQHSYDLIRSKSADSVKKQTSNTVMLYNDLLKPGTLVVTSDNRLTLTGKTNPGGVLLVATKGHHFMKVINSDRTGHFYDTISFDPVTQGESLELIVNNFEVSQDGTIHLMKEAKGQTYVVEQSASKPLLAGEYRVGSDIAPGEYRLMSEQVGQLAWQNGMAKQFTGQFYATFLTGEEITLSGATMLPLDESQGELADSRQPGMLKVGRDLPSGNYPLENVAEGDHSFGKRFRGSVSLANFFGEDIYEREVTLETDDYIYLF